MAGSSGSGMAGGAVVKSQHGSSRAGPSKSAAASARAPGNTSAGQGPGADEAASSQDELALFSTLSAYADALDALPLDLTRSFSDLRELDAVLGTHLSSLTNRLTQLTAIVEDPSFSKGERLLALKEVAEEARAYKMGGEDKIRVALNTAETIISHTTYIDSLLTNITALPALATFLQPAKNSHLAGHLADGTPLAPGSGPGGNNPAIASASAQIDVAASPTKKKKTQGAGPTATTANATAGATASEKRAAQEAAANAGGPGKKRKAPGQSSSSKAKAAATAADSDVDTVGSSSAARRPGVKRAKVNGTASHSHHDDGGGGDDVTGSTARSRAARNNRAGRADLSDDEGASDADVARPARVARAPRMANNSSSDNTMGSASSAAAAGAGTEDADERRYCFCNNVSYGDMIGCDDDECEREWFHLDCVGLLKPPQGTWYCDDCAAKRASRNKSKNRKVAKTSGVHGGGIVEQKSRTSGSKR